MLKRAPAWFIDHVFCGEWFEFGDDVVTGFTADEETSHGAAVPDSFAGRVILAAGEFAGGERGEVRAVAFAGVVDGKAF